MNTSTSGLQHKDQASELRELAGGRRHRADTLAIVSGKGGVGKTNVAVNLSIFLAARKRRVTLVDLDMGLANADLLLGLTPKYTLAHVISGARTLGEVTVAGPAGLRFIPGASGLEQLANLSEFERQILLLQMQSLEDSTDMLVFDCGAGIGRGVMRFAQSAQRVMVVTTPEPTSMTDAYATVKMLAREQYRGAVGILVNKAAERLDADATYRRIAEVAKRFLNYSVANFGFVLQDTSVVQAVRARSPVVIRFPQSKASQCFAAVADSMASGSPTLVRRDSFFQRVAGLFI
jgi:flagellar biosynthesis protein FlhG